MPVRRLASMTTEATFDVDATSKARVVVATAVVITKIVPPADVVPQ